MKKLGFIILALVLALGAIGVGYASLTGWGQSLNIQGTAAVGTFKVYMTNTALVPADQPANSSDTTFSVVPDTATADVASYNVGGNAGLIVTITNAVPGVYTIPGVVIHNDSSIPVSVTVNAVAVNGAYADATTWVGLGGLAPIPSLAANTAPTGKDITITIPDSAAQSTTYGFIIPVSVAQQ
jgi:hypothetical protein